MAAKFLDYHNLDPDRPGDRLNGFKNCKTQLFYSRGVVKWAYFQKKVECSFNYNSTQYLKKLYNYSLNTIPPPPNVSHRSEYIFFLFIKLSSNFLLQNKKLLRLLENKLSFKLQLFRFLALSINQLYELSGFNGLTKKIIDKTLYLLEHCQIVTCSFFLLIPVTKSTGSTCGC